MFRARPPDLPRHPLGVYGRCRHCRRDADAEGLGAAAQYHELESLDYATGEFVVASSGEHDLAFAGEQPGWCGTSGSTRPPLRRLRRASRAPPGPATLVGFTELDAPAPELPLHRRCRGVHRDALARGRDPLCGLSLRERPRRRGLDALVPRGREPPLGSDARRRRPSRASRFLGVESSASRRPRRAVGAVVGPSASRRSGRRPGTLRRPPSEVFRNGTSSGTTYSSR